MDLSFLSQQQPSSVATVKVRRVVTGHDSECRAVIVADRWINRGDTLAVWAAVTVCAEHTNAARV